MTSVTSERSGWIRLLIVAVVALAVAHALDSVVWRSARLLTVNDKDWGRLLRSMGYLPTWGVIALGYWLQQRDVPRRAVNANAYAYALVLGPALGGGIAELLKLAIRRLRPNPDLFEYVFRPFADGPLSNRGMGMPSSHVLVAFTGAAVMAQLYPPARWLWYTLAVGCAVTRVLALGHFLSDTVAAAALGIIVGRWVWGRANRGIATPAVLLT
ncbi:phosphatase PAP2 family protein [Gemmatimonas sp.]|uniref:phosphatase PAP2 family protein n=1 Tax=Gemmatimonas sp. TaxID=1962908 RepID=UPI0039835487